MQTHSLHRPSLHRPNGNRLIFGEKNHIPIQNRLQLDRISSQRALIPQSHISLAHLSLGPSQRRHQQWLGKLFFTFCSFTYLPQFSCPYTVDCRLLVLFVSMLIIFVCCWQMIVVVVSLFFLIVVVDCCQLIFMDRLLLTAACCCYFVDFTSLFIFFTVQFYH